MGYSTLFASLSYGGGRGMGLRSAGGGGGGRRGGGRRSPPPGSVVFLLCKHFASARLFHFRSGTFQFIYFIADERRGLEVELFDRLGHFIALTLNKFYGIIFIRQRIEHEELIDSALMLRA